MYITFKSLEILLQVVKSTIEFKLQFVYSHCKNIAAQNSFLI